MQPRNVVAALAAARELPQLSLEDALELMLLVARKGPRRHPRVAAGWLHCYLEEDPVATIDEAGPDAIGAARHDRGRLPGSCADVTGHC
jgi:hypothetical protein